MKKPVISLMFALASASALPAAVTITVNNFAPNGSASGGAGSGTGAFTTVAPGTEVRATNNGMPVTLYTISNIDLTSEGGGASESFTFTVTYTATTDGTTAGTPQFNSFGNVSVTGGADSNNIEGSETLTATIALASSSFGGLSLTGFTQARAGGIQAGETGTFTHGGGVANIASGFGQFPITGTSVTMAVTNGAMNFEGFSAQFAAVPEPASASLLALGALALLRRRRTA